MIVIIREEIRGKREYFNYLILDFNSASHKMTSVINKHKNAGKKSASKVREEKRR
jgi:hypothetical protein